VSGGGEPEPWGEVIGMLFSLCITFLKIGLFSFGGGFAMIPLLQKEVVSIHGWLTLSEMVDVIAISQMTPGPVAINLATFVGFKVGGIWGSIVATVSVVTPSFVILVFISRFFEKFRETDLVQRIFQGVRPVVVALIGSAGIFIARSSLADVQSFLLVVGSFIAIKYLNASPLLVIFGAGLLGVIFFR